MRKEGKIAIKIPAKASVWYLAASALSKGVGIITTPIFTRLLSGEDYGGFALYMTLLGGASLICSAFNSGSSIYKGLNKNESKKDEYLKSVLSLSILVSLSICLLLFAISPILELNRLFYLPLSLQLLCDSVTAVFLSSERFYYRYKSVFFITVINALIPSVAAVLILINLGVGYSARIYSLLTVSILTALYSLFQLTRKATKSRGSIKEAIAYSLPMLPHCVSTAINLQADKLFLSSLMDASALGKYSVIFSMGSALQFVVSAIGSSMSPWIIRRLKNGEKNKIAELISPMTLGYCALGLCLIAISPEALAILAPAEYFEAFPALLPIALSIPFYFISTLSTVCIVYDGRTKFSLILSAISSALCIILNYTLIGRLGYLGAGLAVFICQATIGTLNLIFLSRTEARGIIDLKRFICYVALYIPLGALIFYLKSSILIRAFLLIIPVAMLLYCLKKANELVIEKTDKS